MALRQHLRAVTEYNIRTLQTSLLAELSGALGDLGTLLPLMIAMALRGSIDLPATLVFSGLANIFTGVYYGIPLPVQPMKAIAAVAISQNFSKQETMAAGLTMGIAVFALSASGTLSWLNRVVPVPIVKGIQVSAGLALTISAGSSMIQPLGWITPGNDNRLLALAAFAFLIITALIPRLPYALLVFSLGLHLTSRPMASLNRHPKRASLENWCDRRSDPTTTTHDPQLDPGSDFAGVHTLPKLPPNPNHNIHRLLSRSRESGWLLVRRMPICHGSGGVAGQYRFGARSGSSIVILGIVKLVLGLTVGEAVVPLLQRFPRSLLGVMVLAAGVELAKVGQSVGDGEEVWGRVDEAGDDERAGHEGKGKVEEERKGRWMVMLVTVAGCLAFKNDAVGFSAGMVWYWGLRVSIWVEHLRHGRVRLGHERRGGEESAILGSR
ncbi:hypothetical protein LTR35_004057 [Friedmanniomyces endolithicus]|uniref:Uncharacterized protein n=1 Tax=Friedmanniomyces endolithicus TaxID=329885 RepID=A0AAN6FXE1_9PEZI|nr:hypothetical protein LTR35_004057 [Friedmanniomyces endolithicus]KAK0325075.1 hypothetical protein LTR82_004061 [Friedmanniomyces endolithicus]